MFDGIAVDGLVLAAVYGEVRLSIAVEIQLAEANAFRGRRFEDSGGYGLAVPEDFARQADVQRDDLHG